MKVLTGLSDGDSFLIECSSSWVTLVCQVDKNLLSIVWLALFKDLDLEFLIFIFCRLLDL